MAASFLIPLLASAFVTPNVRPAKMSMATRPAATVVAPTMIMGSDARMAVDSRSSMFSFADQGGYTRDVARTVADKWGTTTMEYSPYGFGSNYGFNNYRYNNYGGRYGMGGMGGGYGPYSSGYGMGGYGMGGRYGMQYASYSPYGNGYGMGGYGGNYRSNYYGYTPYNFNRYGASSYSSMPQYSNVGRQTSFNPSGSGLWQSRSNMHYSSSPYYY